MKRKDIIIVSAIANAGLLVILLISAVTTKESALSSSSCEVASSILKEDANGMVLEEKKEVIKEPEIVYRLPKIEIAEEKDFFEIIVKKGDSLERIAKRNNTSVGKIIKMNKMNSSFLKIGQTLLIPKVKKNKNKNFSKSKPEKKKEISQKLDYYIVKPGDNPWTISMKHHIKVDDLLRLNNLDSKKAKRLRPGDRLRIR